MKIQSQKKSHFGFTRIELAVALACVTLISTMGITVLGDNRERSERVLCANNLRQIGRAFHMWVSDHGGENPWWTPYRDGGSLISNTDPGPPGNMFNVPGIGPMLATVRNNAWFQFAFINQELRTPGLLACPSEQNKVRAENFSSSTSSRGYLSVSFRDRATSYFIGLHAMNQHPSSILSGDRTLREDNQNATCNANVGSVFYLAGTSSSGWLPSLHIAGGNLLLNDGRVEELSISGLAKFLKLPRLDDFQSHHFIKPLP